MTCAQGLLRLLWGGARSWSATGLVGSFCLLVQFWLQDCFDTKAHQKTLNRKDDLMINKLVV